MEARVKDNSGRGDKAIIGVVKERIENLGEPLAAVIGGKQG